MRNREIGFVFQQFNLLPRTDALGNVELPMIYAGVRPQDAGASARWQALGRGRPRRPRASPARRNCPAASSSASPSPGRWSTARACILADEPTGALDSRTAMEILALFQELNREGVTIVLVTHDADVARHARRWCASRTGA